MGTNQNNFLDWKGDSHDLESLFDWSKGFKDWLEMGISPHILAFKLFCLVLKGLGQSRGSLGIILFDIHIF